MRILPFSGVALGLLLPFLAQAGDGAPLVPSTRTDLKQALENSKHNVPRLPLPPMTEEEKVLASQPVDLSKGKFGVVNNGRMRKFYLPTGAVTGGLSRDPDPAMSLGYPFQTRLFWIVSRGNNCTYCMGHQEAKLAAVGMSDDEIAALDGDWSEAGSQERAAYEFTRKLTAAPHQITDADLADLRTAGYTNAQILEMVLVDSNFNAMNRWTGALRIPQEEHREYLTPTTDKFAALASRIAPATETGEARIAAPVQRPQPDAETVSAALKASRVRSPRLPLVDDAQARQILGAAAPASGPLPQWMRLLATFPKAGPGRVAMYQAAQQNGELPPRFKAIVAYVAARNDRAWYALDVASNRLKALGFSDPEIAALVAQSAPLSAEERKLLKATQAGGTPAVPAERVVASFARKLTTDPARIEDFDVEGLRLYFSDKATAEVIHHVAESAFFDRLTETSGLTLEP